MGYRRLVDDNTPAIRLEAWTETDLSLLRATNTQEMMEHLGGPETESQVLDRHRRYLELGDPGAGQMFAVALPDGQQSGVIGYWERSWRDSLTYETGWSILPAFQGRGIATAAARAVAVLARAEHRHSHLHAFPAVDHPASNAICRKAGFTLLGEADIEYPPGSIMRCHEWRLDL
jgi:RimJ/RimL family protein N-acetyltransferase